MPVSDTGAGSKLMENAIIIVIKLMINDAVWANAVAIRWWIAIMMTLKWFCNVFL